MVEYMNACVIRNLMYAIHYIYIRTGTSSLRVDEKDNSDGGEILAAEKCGELNSF